MINPKETPNRVKIIAELLGVDQDNVEEFRESVCRQCNVTYELVFGEKQNNSQST